MSRLSPRTVIAIGLVLPLVGEPALAQSGGKPASHKTPRHLAETPVDRGPFTPEASRAYQGGGVVLQAAPGAPPPKPEPTPPGQAPRNMVPPGS